jgi:hypothetical protein
MTTQTIRNGASIRLNVLPGQSVAVVAVSGTYNASIVQGAGLGVIATAATGGTYGPYASGIVILLTASAASEIDFDVAVTPVIVSDTLVTASIDPVTGGVKGLVDTKGSGYLLGANGFVPATDDYAGIIAAHNAAVAAGGGTVQLLPVTYTVTGTIPLSSGVIYNGVQGSYDEFTNIFSGGTVIIPTGAFPVFGGNYEDVAQPATTESFLLGMINGCGVTNLGINCNGIGTYGVKIGGLYNPGSMLGVFSHLNIFGATEWGFWSENMEHDEYRYMDSGGSGVGCIKITSSGIASSGGTYNYGDSTIYSCIGSPKNLRTKGVEISARVVGCQLNNIKGYHLGASGGGTQSVQVATLTASSTLIGVTDLSKFALDMGVVFSATTGNINGGASQSTSRKCYFVISMSGSSGAGNITISNMIGGDVLTPSASGTPNITTAGSALFAVVGYGQTGGAQVANSSFMGVTCENQGTAAIVMQNANGNYVEINDRPYSSATAGAIHDFVGRNIAAGQGTIDARCQLSSVDIDGSGTSMWRGTKPTATVNSGGFGVGVLYNPSIAFGALSLTGAPDLWVSQNYTMSTRYPFVGAGLIRLTASYTANINDGQGVFLHGTTAEQTFTLPPPLGGFSIGWCYPVVNQSTQSWTVNGNGKDIWTNGVAAATTTVAAKTACMLVLGHDGTTFSWSRIG